MLRRPYVQCAPSGRPGLGRRLFDPPIPSAGRLAPVWRCIWPEVSEDRVVVVYTRCDDSTTTGTHFGCTAARSARRLQSRHATRWFRALIGGSDIITCNVETTAADMFSDSKSLQEG